MDSYNIIWCTLWSDYFMAQHQFDPKNNRFSVPVKVAADFLFYLSEMLGEEKQGYYANNEEKFVAVELAADEIEKITDWIVDFNFATRKPLGLVMPDLYLDEEQIATKTVNIYCQRISEFIAYMNDNQDQGRDAVAEWAAQNFIAIYSKASAEALHAKTAG